jgi:hypothetical protein
MGLRVLDQHELDQVAGGFQPPVNFPGDTPPPALLIPAINGEGILIPEGLGEALANILRDFAIGLGVNVLYGELNDPPETWETAPASPSMSTDEVNISNWLATVGRGQSSETGYNTIHLNNIGDGDYFGVYFAEDGSQTSYFAEDADHDGAFDAIYKDVSGTWYKATATNANGDPIWIVSDAPDRFKTPQHVDDGSDGSE